MHTGEVFFLGVVYMFTLLFVILVPNLGRLVLYRLGFWLFGTTTRSFLCIYLSLYRLSPTRVLLIIFKSENDIRNDAVLTDE